MKKQWLFEVTMTDWTKMVNLIRLDSPDVWDILNGDVLQKKKK